jgi:branched-chain amino acid transport system substrate-binding protein
LTLLETATNSAGGINGRPLHFNVLDDQSDPRVAVQLANALVEQKSSIVLGPVVVATCAAVAPIFRDRIVNYCYSPGLSPAEGSYTFSAGISSKDIAVAALRYLRSRSITKLGAIWITDATGQDAERAVVEALKLPENSGMAIVANEHFAPTDLSVSAQFSHLTAAGAQACLCWATGTGLATLMHAYSDAGLGYPVFTSTGNMSKPLMDQIASFRVPELYFAAFPYFGADAARGELKSAIAKFHAAFDSAGLKPNTAAGYVWDSTSIALLALQKLGPAASAAQLRSFIAGLRGFAGIDGVYNFQATPQRGLDSKYATIVRWDPSQGTWIAAVR